MSNENKANEPQTTTLTTCNGKINSRGYCDKCFDISQTSSAYCPRLYETPNPEPQKEESEVVKLIEYFEQQKRLQDDPMLISSGREAYDDAIEVCKNILKANPTPQKEQEKKKKILTTESIPEFNESINNMSQESKEKVDNLIRNNSQEKEDVCTVCKGKIGNNVFTVCDDCWPLNSVTRPPTPNKEGEYCPTELIKAYDEYIALLSNSPAETMAYVHGYKHSEENIKKGKELREKISLLKSQPTDNQSSDHLG